MDPGRDRLSIADSPARSLRGLQAFCKSRDLSVDCVRVCAPFAGSSDITCRPAIADVAKRASSLHRGVPRFVNISWLAPREPAMKSEGVESQLTLCHRLHRAEMTSL